ncbi:hypothetical protein E1B28_009012 [Marasmius oreades]|uniref:Signal recognition particle receptor subunit beta n=1 Tax=Marasmius oreades TaxID=181124 RepID=A0A9P7S044_9AGAR|nr:uncharacterized protein E1B28_009012 [Marasmius oreades]KAG7092678.1 hypothetical protein E1B28_009012 [Marasmius oreades]
MSLKTNTTLSWHAPFSQPPYFVPASLFVALLLTLIAFSITRRNNASRGNALLFLGPPESGKTSIMSQLVYGVSPATHTSLQTNAALVNLPGKKHPIRVVDVPGHPRIRDQFHDFLLDAKAIVFVVDVNLVSRNGPAVAEHLHSIMKALLSLPPSHKLPTLIILAHKTDLIKASATSGASSLAVDRVQKILQRELEKRRLAQSGGMGVETLDSEDEKSDITGLECTSPGGVFQFESWEGGEVVFMGSSVKLPPSDTEKGPSSGLQTLEEWMDENL